MVAGDDRSDPSLRHLLSHCSPTAVHSSACTPQYSPPVAVSPSLGTRRCRPVASHCRHHPPRPTSAAASLSPRHRRKFPLPPLSLARPFLIHLSLTSCESPRRHHYCRQALLREIRTTRDPIPQSTPPTASTHLSQPISATSRASAPLLRALHEFPPSPSPPCTWTALLGAPLRQAKAP